MNDVFSIVTQYIHQRRDRIAFLSVCRSFLALERWFMPNGEHLDLLARLGTNRRAFRQLLQDPRLSSHRKRPALRIAAKHGHLDHVECYLDVTILTDDANIFQAFCMACKYCQYDVVHLLLGLDWTMDDMIGKIAIRLARAGFTEILKAFLERFPGQSDAIVQSALFQASEFGHAGTVQLLLTRSPDAQTDAAMNIACKNGHTGVVAVLLRANTAEISSVAIYDSIMNCHRGTVQLLLSDPRVRLTMDNTRWILKFWPDMLAQI